MATSKIQIVKPIEVIENSINITSSTTLSYTGVSINVIRGKPYMLLVDCVYMNGAPLECYLNYSPDICDVYTKYSGGNMSHLFYGGIESSDRTFYVWARYANSSLNKVMYTLVYL